MFWFKEFLGLRSPLDTVDTSISSRHLVFMSLTCSGPAWCVFIFFLLFSWSFDLFVGILSFLLFARFRWDFSQGCRALTQWTSTRKGHHCANPICHTLWWVTAWVCVCVCACMFIYFFCLHMPVSVCSCRSSMTPVCAEPPWLDITNHRNKNIKDVSPEKLLRPELHLFICALIQVWRLLHQHIRIFISLQQKSTVHVLRISDRSTSEPDDLFVSIKSYHQSLRLYHP